MGRGTSRNRSSLVIFSLGEGCLVQSVVGQDLERAGLDRSLRRDWEQGSESLSSCVGEQRFATLSIADISGQFDRAIAAVNIVL